MNTGIHVAGLNGVPVVETRQLRMTRSVVSSAVAYNEIVLIYGDAGLGKTLAVNQAVIAEPMPHLWVQIGPNPQPKEVVVRLIKAIEGDFPKGTLYELVDQLIELLDDQPRIVVIDEAQNFGKKGIDQLRNIHDRCGFPLILVGGAPTNAVIASDPQLNDRVAGRVPFAPLPKRELFNTLRAYHSYLGDADADLIYEIDQTYAKGVFRRWARILKEGLALTCDDSDAVLDRRTTRAILAKIKGAKP